jgi:hypothetical protein
LLRYDVSISYDGAIVKKESLRYFLGNGAAIWEIAVTRQLMGLWGWRFVKTHLMGENKPHVKQVVSLSGVVDVRNLPGSDESRFDGQGLTHSCPALPRMPRRGFREGQSIRIRLTEG